MMATPVQKSTLSMLWPSVSDEILRKSLFYVMTFQVLLT